MKTINIIPDTETQNFVSLQRLTALWAFSESTLGGILHAFKIPLTGFFIGGTAVLFISLIAKYSEQRSAVLRATLIVIIIKALVSPHTPLTAYFAVFVQGLLGYLLFYNKRFYAASALTLGIAALLLSALQKVIILTIIFGNNLWESIDVFADQVSRQFGYGGISFSFSGILAGGYIFLHVTGGVIFGIMAGRLPGWIETQKDSNYKYDQTLMSSYPSDIKTGKSFLKKPAAVIFAFLLVIMFLFSITNESFVTSRSSVIIIMILRSILVMTIWFTILSPLLLRLFHKILRRRMIRYTDEINEIVNIFPFFQKHYRIKLEECF